MHAVHRVVPDQLGHPLHDVGSGFREGRVQVQPVAHGADPLRVGVCQVVLGQVGRHCRRAAQAVGVDPRLQREAPAVRLGDEDIQRVEARVLPLHAGAQVAPRVEGAAVERIPKGPHLHENGVEPQRGAVIQQLGCARPERSL